MLIDSKAEKTKHDLIFKANEKSIDFNILWPAIEELENQLEKSKSKRKFFNITKICSRMENERKFKNV